MFFAPPFSQPLRWISRSQSTLAVAFPFITGVPPAPNPNQPKGGVPEGRTAYTPSRSDCAGGLYAFQPPLQAIEVRPPPAVAYLPVPPEADPIVKSGGRAERGVQEGGSAETGEAWLSRRAYWIGLPATVASGDCSSFFDLMISTPGGTFDFGTSSVAVIKLSGSSRGNEQRIRTNSSFES